MNRAYIYVCLLLMSLISASSFADEVFYQTGDTLTGEIQNISDKKLLYNYTRVVEHQGTDKNLVTRAYVYPDGKPAVTETMLYTGGRVTKMMWQQFQVNEEGQFEIKNGKVYFTYKKDGVVEQSNQPLDDDFVSQDELLEFIYKNWATLMSGKNVKFHLPVIYRQETIGFKLSKLEETSEGIKISMKPSSFFVAAAFGKPIVFTLKKDGDHRVLSVEGRVSPKIQENKVWKDLNALLLINY